MFQRNTFGRARRRPETVLLQFVLLSVIFFVSIIGVVAFMHFSSPPSGAATQAEPTVAIVDTAGQIDLIVPTDNIVPGVPLEPSMFRRDKRPEDVVGPEMVRDFEEVRGLYTKGLLIANQPVNRDLLTGLQPVNALTASIPTGYRAIAIPVDATSSVEGWAQAGARVDVFWVTTLTGRRTVSMVAANAKVLSANNKTEGVQKRDPSKAPSDEIPHTVTLLLSSKDALRVRLSSLHGRLSLVLRGSEDSGAVASSNPIPESALYSTSNLPVMEQTRNLVTVKVKDRTTGKEEDLTFENGERVRE
jgi:pilus assembly protein CpaB